ncbi:MAG: S8 family serine peptidase [Promethearchaeota archaeon]
MKVNMLLKKRPLVSLTFSVILCFSMFIGISGIPLANLATSFPTLIPGTDSNTFFSGKPTTSSSDSNTDPLANIHSNLRTWLKTGIAPDNIRSNGNSVGVLLGCLRDVDLIEVSDHMTIKNVFGYPGGYLVQGFVPTPKDLIFIDKIDYTGSIIGDQKLDAYSEGADTPVTDQYLVQQIIQNDLVQDNYPEIDGTGITIGIVDTGTDFGHTDLADAYATNSSGYPTSFDPGGLTLAITSYALPSVGGYLLTAGLDFPMWAGDFGGIRYSYSTYGVEVEDMYVGGFGGIVSQSGFYKVGMDVHVGSSSGVRRQFFVFILVDSVTPFVYDTLYVDFETSFALSADFNGFSTSVSADWDFTNNDPHMWGDGTEVLAIDFDGNGSNDYSMGCLSNTFDLFGVINGDLVSGIDRFGRGFSCMYDPDGHGTSTAGSAAGRGIVEYDLYGNGTLYTTPGVAPGAKIMALMLFTYGDIINCWFWGSGYRPIYLANNPYNSWYDWDHCGYFGYDYSNQAQILSNSWGFIGYFFTAPYNFQWGNDWYSYTMDFLSTGGLTDDTYSFTGWTPWYEPVTPEIFAAPLFVVSQGNAGPGWGTSGSPSSETALMVGASTTTHYAQPTYNNDSSLGPQPYDQIADFSSNGPTPQSVPKPDVVAPGAWAFDIAPLHYSQGDGNSSWTTFGGTSQAAPIAAGVAALAFQAAGSPPGNLYGVLKSAIMSGTDDLNQPALRQGAGRVNAWRTVNIAFGNDTTDGATDYLPGFACNYTFSNWGLQHDPATWSRSWYMNMYFGELIGSIPYYGESYDHPGYYVQWLSGSFTTHSIMAGESKEIQAYAGTSTLALDGIDAEWYTLLNESTKTFTSTSVYTTYSLFADGHFDKIFQDQFMNDADYAVIHVSYGADKFEQLFALTGDGNYVFLHDWNDTNEDGVINFAGTEGVGEVRRVMFDYSATPCSQIHVGNPGDQWNGNMNATIYYHDVGNEVYLWRTLDVTITIRLYQRVDWSWFSFTQHSSNVWNITCTVPGGVSPGIYEGFIKATKGTVDKYFPITVRVDGQVGPGDSLTWGGTDGHPFDQGAITGAIDYNGRKASGEWRWYMVDVSDINTGDNFTTWIMTNVTWTDPDTCIDVYTLMAGYGVNGYLGGWFESSTSYVDDGHWVGTPTWECQNVLLTDYTWGPGSCSNRGYLIIALHVSSYGGNYVPENITITVTPVNNATQLGFEDLPGPSGMINCTSAAGIAQNTQVVDDMSINGPHVILNGTYDSWGLDGFPTLEIRETDLQVLLSSQLEIHGLFVEANATPNTAAGGPWDFTYTWSGIAAGMLLELNLEVLGGDPGPPSAPHDCELFLMSPSGVLIGSSTNAGSIEDITIGSAPESGDYLIGVDYWGIDAGANYVWCGYDLPFVVYASAAAIYPHIQAGLTSGFDTHTLGLNTVIDLKLKGWTGTSIDFGTGMDVDVKNVSITNFFAPTLAVTSPNGGEIKNPGSITITWTASDANLDEILGFTVEVSNDTGATWKLVVFGTTLMSATWDSLNAFYGLPSGDQFMVRVNCTDGMYTVSDTSDAVFTILPVETTIQLPYELYIVIAVAVIVILILVVTCLLKRRQVAAK